MFSFALILSVKPNGTVDLITIFVEGFIEIISSITCSTELVSNFPVSSL